MTEAGSALGSRLRCRASGAALLLVFSFGAPGCSQRESSEPALQASHQTQLGAGVAALAAGQTISVASVQRIAAAQNVSLKEARNRAIHDVLLARAARERLHPSQLRSAERALLARALLEELLAEAERQGEPSERELAELIEERWVELDRGPAVRCTHAVVLSKSPEDDARARALALSIAAAVKGVKDVAEFKTRAQAVAAQVLEVRVESLPFVTSDARSFYRDKLRPTGAASSDYDADFARAAHALANPGDISEPAKTRFGYHVIYLEERLPERRVSASEALELLAADVMSKRAARAQTELVARLERTHPQSVVRSADELTASIRIQP
jgi:hypothetical protein